MSRAEAEKKLQLATAQFSVHRGVPTTSIRPLIEALRGPVDAAPWPRPTIVRRAGAARRRTHTLIGVAAAAVAVVLSGTLVTDLDGVRASLDRDPLATSPAQATEGSGDESVPEPVEFSGDDLLSAHQVEDYVAGRKWEELETSDNTNGRRPGPALPAEPVRRPAGHGCPAPHLRNQPPQGRRGGVGLPADRDLRVHPVGATGLRHHAGVVRRLHRPTPPADDDPADDPGRRLRERPRAAVVGRQPSDDGRGGDPQRCDHDHDDDLDPARCRPQPEPGRPSRGGRGQRRVRPAGGGRVRVPCRGPGSRPGPRRGRAGHARRGRPPAGQPRDEAVGRHRAPPGQRQRGGNRVRQHRLHGQADEQQPDPFVRHSRRETARGVRDHRDGRHDAGGSRPRIRRRRTPRGRRLPRPRPGAGHRGDPAGAPAVDGARHDRVAPDDRARRQAVGDLPDGHRPRGHRRRPGRVRPRTRRHDGSGCSSSLSSPAPANGCPPCRRPPAEDLDRIGPSVRTSRGSPASAARSRTASCRP